MSYEDFARQFTVATNAAIDAQKVGIVASKPNNGNA